MARLIGVALLLLSVGACGVHAVPPPIDVSLIGAVVGQIKEEVGLYETTVRADRPAAGTLIQPSPGIVCGNGLVDFDIVSVTAALTTKVVVTNSGSVAVTVPLGTTGGTVKPSGNGSEIATNSQVLTFTMYPILPVDDRVRPGATPADHPIAATLLNLRTALRQAAKYLPCMSTAHDPAHDPDNTFVLGLDIQDTGGGGIALSLVLLDASYTHTRETTQTHTITVAFRPTVPASDRAKPTVPAAGGVRDPFRTWTLRPRNLGTPSRGGAAPASGGPVI